MSHPVPAAPKAKADPKAKPHPAPAAPKAKAHPAPPDDDSDAPSLDPDERYQQWLQEAEDLATHDWDPNGNVYSD